MMEGWCTFRERCGVFDGEVVWFEKYIVCIFEGDVRVERGGTFCGDVVLFTERWCFFAER